MNRISVSDWHCEQTSGVEAYQYHTDYTNGHLSSTLVVYTHYLALIYKYGFLSLDDGCNKVKYNREVNSISPKILLINYN